MKNLNFHSFVPPSDYHSSSPFHLCRLPYYIRRDEHHPGSNQRTRRPLCRLQLDAVIRHQPERDLRERCSKKTRRASKFWITNKDHYAKFECHSARRHSCRPRRSPHPDLRHPLPPRPPACRCQAHFRLPGCCRPSGCGQPRHLPAPTLCEKNPSPADQSLPPGPPHPGNACERGIRRRRRSRLLVATQATEAVIQKACSQGIAMAATHNHGHVGSCGIYARMALKHNLVTWAVASNVLCSPSRTGAPSGSRHEHHHVQRPG